MTSGAKDGPMGYGLIGAGAFGQFCLQQYRQMDEMRVVAVADANTEAAKIAAHNLGVEACASVDELLDRADIGIVHIATPPFTHRELAMKALDRGKHVLCEKPLATNIDDARVMIDLAKSKRLLLAVNLIMRYNPLCTAIQRIVAERLLGEPLHGFFENYAKDEPLPASHWFWDKTKSGGIFIEHGVHFFDLFNGWLAPESNHGRVVAAQQVERPNTRGVVEQVQATLRYPGDVIVNHYHGFTQAARMDRQEMRLLFERGTIRLFEWVPTKAEIDFLGTTEQLERLKEILPEAKIRAEETYQGEEREVTSRFRKYTADARYHIVASPGMDKEALYGHVIRELMADQIAAARDPNHLRRVTEDNGFTSLQTAVEAEQLASGE